VRAGEGFMDKDQRKDDFGSRRKPRSTLGARRPG